MRVKVNAGDIDDKVGQPANYCYFHNIIFKDVIDYSIHKKLCKKQCKPYTCSMMAESGDMCGQECNGGTSLYLHGVKEHRVHMCVDCDFVTRKEKFFRTHKHYTENGRKSK